MGRKILLLDLPTMRTATLEMRCYWGVSVVGALGKRSASVDHAREKREAGKS
jgi:hypothetical protein